MMGLRVALALAYPLLAHLAGARGDGAWAAVAMADLVLLLLLGPLLERRPWALLLLASSLLVLWWISLSRYALLPLLLPPMLFLGLVGWFFGRTLRPGRVPLITRIVEALNAQAGLPMTPDLYRYTRRLTAVWAVLLAVLALVNLLLALCAVPGGMLAQFGYRPPLTVSDEQWSWVANFLNYGIVAALFCGEYLWRKRLFPQRPYRNFLQFLQQMARLGPGFWSRLMR
nr:ketosynthase [Pseudoxanthomonas yeongjuensis]